MITSICELFALAWLGLAAAAVGITHVPSLNTFTFYGKSRAMLKAASETIVVPKSWFSHYYMFALVVNTACVLWAAQSPWWPCAGAHSIMAGVLFQLHLARRLCECLFVHSYAPGSTMPMLVYLGGLAHYLFAPLSFLAAPGSCSFAHNEFASSLAACAASPTAVAGMALFVFGNVLQNLCHRYLASLRHSPSAARQRGAKAAANHFLPTWGPFRLVCCPHYTAEICIYTGLWLVCGASAATPLALAIWTACNLCVTGTRTLAWYRDTFGRQRTAGLRAVFPSVL